MRLAWMGVALSLESSAALAAARPACLVLRPADATATPAVAAAYLGPLLDALPVAPEALEPLVGSTSVARTASKPSLARALGAAARPPGGGSHPLGRWLVLRFPSVLARDAALAALGREPSVVAEPVRELGLDAVAEPVRELGLDVVAGPVRELLLDAVAVAPEVPINVRQVRAPEALALVHPDSSIVVGIVDTGIDLAHPDLAGRIWQNDDPPGNASTSDDTFDQNGDGIVEQWERDDDDDNGYVDDWHGYDFTDAPGKEGLGDALGRDPDPSDEQGHGTHVAGILAANGSLQGVAPFVQVMPLRAAFTTLFGGVLETDDAAAAIVYAVDNGARVLNLSWGDREESKVVREAVEYALERGVLVVAAAGNGATTSPHFPSAEPGVISVGAVDAYGARAGFSNHGPSVALYAPGERFAGTGGGIESLAPGGGRATLRGTSMAAPHVAGVAAIVMSRADRPDAERVRALLHSTAQRTSPTDWSDDLSHGVVDALSGIQTEDDLLLQVTGAVDPFAGGALHLSGTVAGGDLARWRADARALSGGPMRELVPWRAERAVGAALVEVPLERIPEGDWEYVVTAETGAGERRTAHGAFTVDFTAPRVDTLFALAAWRGAEPRWLVSVATDEPVSLQVLPMPDDTLALHDPGRSRRTQIETAPVPGAGASWRVRLRNAAGLACDTTLAGVAALPAWPGAARLAQLDATDRFRPEAVWGPGPTGAVVAWGSGLQGDSTTTMQAWGVEAGRLVMRHDTRLAGRPAGTADANGDGGADLLFQARGRVRWLVTRGGAGGFPDSLLADVAAERAIGLFQLDQDAPCEAILSSRDSLLIYDDAASGPPQLRQVLLDPSRRGFDVFGADAAVGDLDGDGRIEIACGDAEGRVTVFERTLADRYELEWSAETGGVYAYDLTALPAGGFVVGRQRTRSVTGDGFATAAFEFLCFAPVPGGFGITAGDAFLGAENDLGAGSQAARSPATGADWLVLVRGVDLYLMSGPQEALQLVSHLEGADGEPPVLADLDADGALDILLRSPEGARLLRLDEFEIGPHDLGGEPLDANRLRLEWTPGSLDTVRIWRAHAGSWEARAETASSAWVDSTLVPGETYEYEVRAIASGAERGVSNRLAVQARPLPRLLAASALGSASLRVACSNPLGAAALAPQRWRVADARGDALSILQVALAAGGREAQLFLAAVLPCGTCTVSGAGVRDDQGARIAPGSNAVALEVSCVTERFAVGWARLEPDAIVVQFTRAPEPTTLDPSRFELRWQGTRLPLLAVEPAPGARLRIVPGPGVEFVGWGIAYELRLDPELRAAGDGARLAYPGTVYLLRAEGLGAARVFAYPNPVRPGDEAVVFAAAASGTRLEIFDLEGQRVRSLQGAVGGGLRWDLCDAAGRRVAAGAYLFVARDASGTRTGRIVIAR